MKTLEPYLAEHPFLLGMDPQHIALMVGCAKNMKFDAGEYLFHEGDDATNIYFIRHGKLALEFYRPHKGAIIFQTLVANDVLGWSWLIEPYLRHFDCRATELTRVIAVDGSCLRDKCVQDHDLGYELLKRFSHLMEDELMALRLQLMDIYNAPH